MTTSYSPFHDEPRNTVEQEAKQTLSLLLEYSRRLAKKEEKNFKEESAELFDLSESGDALWTEQVHLEGLEPVGVDVRAVEDDCQSEAMSSDGTSSVGHKVWIHIPRKEGQPLPLLEEPEDEEGKRWLVNPRQDAQDGEPRGVRQLKGEEMPPNVKRYLEQLREWRKADRLKKLCNGLYDLHIRGESMVLTGGIGLLRGPFYREGSDAIECAFPVLEFSVKVEVLSDSGCFEVYPSDEELSVSAKVFDLFDETTAKNVRKTVLNSSDTLSPVCYEPGKHDKLLQEIAVVLKVPLSNRDDNSSEVRGGDSKRRLCLEKTWTLHRAPEAQHSSAVAEDANRLQELLKSSGVVPGFCLALTHADDPRVAELMANQSRGSMQGAAATSMEGLENEVLFPFQFNDEQREVMDRSETHPLVVVDGPPGTGKTQTIGESWCMHSKRSAPSCHTIRLSTICTTTQAAHHQHH